MAILWKLKQRDFPQLLAIKLSSLLIFMWPVAEGKRNRAAQEEPEVQESQRVASSGLANLIIPQFVMRV